MTVLPYRYQFDGASGPLTFGVWHYKQIIGPNNGSLGDVIVKNDLGSTFKCEDVDSLRETIRYHLSQKSRSAFSDAYLLYRQKLDSNEFLSQLERLYSETVLCL